MGLSAENTSAKHREVGGSLFWTGLALLQCWWATGWLLAFGQAGWPASREKGHSQARCCWKPPGLLGRVGV